MSGATPFHGLPLDDMRSHGSDASRIAPTNAEVAATARFQDLDLVPAAGRTQVSGATLRIDDPDGGGRLTMSDPQQPDLAARAAAAANAAMYDCDLDGVSTIKTASGTTMLAMVEPAIFTSFERPRVVVSAPRDIDPEEVARSIIADARDAARAMLAQAKHVIEAERTQATEEGRVAGHAQGMAEADVETAGLISTCERIGIHVMEERQRVLEEQESDTVELAIAIAERIVGAALDVTPELVVEACRGAMRKAFQRESMQVLAHPDDLSRLRDAGPQLAAELGGVEHLDFLEERRLDRGSIVVRTPAGEIDATIAGKAERIEQALREGIESRRAERRAAG